MPQFLFQIYDTAHRAYVPDSQCTSKQQAKKIRKELNRVADSAVRFIVAPGPDHKRFDAHPQS